MPSFVEEAYFSGSRMGEAIDWCIDRHDRELHCDVQGVLNSTGKEVRFKGRILKFRKGVLTRRIAVLVEEDLRRKKVGRAARFPAPYGGEEPPTNCRY
jgi:hypothetical protein